MELHKFLWFFFKVGELCCWFCVTGCHALGSKWKQVAFSSLMAMGAAMSPAQLGKTLRLVPKEEVGNTTVCERKNELICWSAMEMARKLRGFVGKGPRGWKSLRALTFFCGKRLCCLYAAPRSWDPSQPCTAGRSDPDSLWSSGRGGDTGQRPWVTNPKHWAGRLAYLLLYLLPFTFRQPLFPGTTLSRRQGWGTEEKNWYSCNDPKMKWSRKFPWKCSFFPPFLPRQAALISTGKYTWHFLFGPESP